MKEKISFKNILLFCLTLTVLWLVYEIGNVTPDGVVYMPNQESGFMVIKTHYGSFPVIIDKTKPIEDGTELALILINPLNVHFADAEISAQAQGSTETARTNLVPGANKAKLKIPRIQRGDSVEIRLGLDKIYFK